MPKHVLLSCLRWYVGVHQLVFNMLQLQNLPLNEWLCYVTAMIGQHQGHCQGRTLNLLGFEEVLMLHDSGLQGSMGDHQLLLHLRSGLLDQTQQAQCLHANHPYLSM